MTRGRPPQPLPLVELLREEDTGEGQRLAMMRLKEDSQQAQACIDPAQNTQVQPGEKGVRYHRFLQHLQASIATRAPHAGLRKWKTAAQGDQNFA